MGEELQITTIMKKPTFSRIVAFISLLFLGLQSYAQNYVPFTPRFNKDVRGDIVLIGNNIFDLNCYSKVDESALT